MKYTFISLIDSSQTRSPLKNVINGPFIRFHSWFSMAQKYIIIYKNYAIKFITDFVYL